MKSLAELLVGKSVGAAADMGSMDDDGDDDGPMCMYHSIPNVNTCFPSPC